MSTTSTQNSKGASNEEKNEIPRENGGFVGLDIGFPEEPVPLMAVSKSSEKIEFVCNVTEKKTEFGEVGPTRTSSEQDLVSSSDDSSDNLQDSMTKDPSQKRAVTLDFKHKIAENQDDDFSSDSDGNEQELPSLLRRMSMAPSRSKTRFHDAPHHTQAIHRQLTHSRSSVLKKTTSLDISKEQQHLRREDGGNASVCSRTPEENENDSESNVMLDDVDDLTSDEDGDFLDDDVNPASKKRNQQGIKWTTYFQLIILIFLIVFLVCSYKIEVLKDATFLDLHLWRWDSLTLVVFCGRLLSDWFIKLLEMLIKRHYMLKKRVLYFVYGLRQSVKNCIWLALVLAVWESIFEGLEGNLLVYILTKILFCIFTASVSWMFKVLAVKVAASTFHRKVYFERMQECIFNQYLLEVLSGPPRTGDTGCSNDRQSTDLENKKGMHKTGGKQSTSTPSMQRTRRFSRNIELPFEQSKIQELTSDTVSVWTVKNLMKTIRKANISTYSSIISHEKIEGEIDSEGQAKAAAKQIFYNMARPGQKSLTIKDFLYFLPEDHAMRAFQLFEVTEAGEITKKALAKWVISVYKEHRALSLTLNDNRTVVAKLHKVLTVVLCAALAIVFLLIFGIETSKLLLFFTSFFIPSVFIFGNSARTTFEALLFLFVVHPFDVGDRVVIDGQRMIVEEMHILNTVFLGPTNDKIYFPNAALGQKWIVNYNRSPDQGDSIDFQINMKTPVKKLGILKERIQQYIESLPQFWYPEFRIMCDKIHDCNKMNLMIWLRHRINYQDICERYQRRSNLLLHLKQQLEDLDIGYQLPSQEISVKGIPLMNML